MTEFDRQVLQIAGLGVWQIVTSKPMTKRLTPVEHEAWGSRVGAFVTLRKHGTVRGSVGCLESSTTLQETLFDLGGAAATHDSRYPPVKEVELDELELEVTLIKEIRVSANVDDIKIGRTGVVISRGEARGILLPKVASEKGWTGEQFLEACCEKAGLSHKAWRDPNTLVEIFDGVTVNAPLLEEIRDFV